jgi:alpha-tubulin suppressor-like RCC1 family protein
MRSLLGTKTIMVATVALAATRMGTAHAGADTRLPGPFPVIAAGDTHALFIRPDGWVWGWGDNTYGELGDGTNTQRFTATQAHLSAAVQVSAGVQFSVALMGDGTIYTWGRDDLGQLGNGTSTTSKTAYVTPKKMGTAGDWRFVTAGRAHALAIKIDGTMWGWGDNANGQLGLGGSKLTAQKTPQRIGTGSDWIAAAAGKSFSIALRADGTLWGCGINDQGQLGVASLPTSGANVLTQIGATTDHWLSVSAGTAYVLAIKDDGSIWSWGQNDVGQLGDGTKTNHTPPAKASSGPYRAIAAGDKHSLAVRWDGAIYGWGTNTVGQLGAGNKTSHTSATSIGATRGQYIAAGRDFSMFLSADGIINLAGQGSSGQLGSGSDVTSSTTRIGPYVSFQGDEFNYGVKPNMIAAGTAHALAIRSLGTIESWGANHYGGLGPNASGTQVPNPSLQYSLSNDWIHVAGGDYHTLAVSSAGQLWAWGGNGTGELGIGSADSSSHPQPTQLLTTKKILRVAAHYESSLALTTDGLMYAWGDNSSGQTGTNKATTASVYTPTAVAIPSGSHWVALGISNDRAAAIRSDGTLWGWGRLDGSTPVIKPKQILTGQTADSNWVTIGVGGGQGIVAVKANGQMYAVNGTTATAIATNLRANLLAVTHNGVLVSLAGGLVYCFGDFSEGQLGNGTGFGSAPSSSPVASYYFNPRALAAGGAFSWEIVANGGGRQIAGYNDEGELGLGYVGGDMTDPTIISNGFDF